MRFKSKGYIRVYIYTTSYTASQSKYLKTQDSIVVRYKTILLTIARFTRIIVRRLERFIRLALL